MRTKQWRQGLTIGVLVLVALWLGSLIWGLIGKAEIAIAQAHDAKRQYRQLEHRKEVLQQQIDVLETPLGRDAAIRTAFGVAKPGEEVIVVVPPASTTALTTKPWWRRVLHWF